METNLTMTHAQQIYAFQICSSLNNDSKHTRAPLPGKWLTKEKYNYQQPGKFVLEKALNKSAPEDPTNLLSL
jgi:hypothetical protein